MRKVESKAVTAGGRLDFFWTLQSHFRLLKEDLFPDITFCDGLSMVLLKTPTFKRLYGTR